SETPSWCRRQSIRIISLHVSLTERTATNASNQPSTTGADDAGTVSPRDRVVAGQRPGTPAYHRHRTVRTTRAEASEFELGFSGNQRVHTDPVNKTTTESK